MFNFRTKWSVPVFVIRLRPVQIIRESIWTGPRLGPKINTIFFNRITKQDSFVQSEKGP